MTDQQLESFVQVAPGSHFPIQNLPFGVFRPRAAAPPRVGVAIGEHVLDLAVLAELGLISGPDMASGEVFARGDLNGFMALGRPAWRKARTAIQRLLSRDQSTLRDDAAVRDAALLPMSSVEMLLPAAIGDYTDFYSSREHATNVGTMFRGQDNALQPNWLHLPVGYHGRSSSVVVSGTPVRRPMGQTKADDAERPSYGPSRLMDFELEVGFFVGPGTELGQQIPIERAADHIFGMVLVNDWSARDIQKWEYVPLGPFLGKSFATSISPWVVTLEALEPLRCAGPVQNAPEPLEYLKNPVNCAYDIRLEVSLATERHPKPMPIASSNSRYLYWSMCQQLAHHTVNGCNVRPGDLMASGTISGPEKHERGSMLELSWRGSEPLELPSGETRKFLADGDTAVMTGWGEHNSVRIGFGEVRGTLLPALG